MKEIEYEKHAYVVRIRSGPKKGRNKKKKTTTEQQEGILFYKKIPRIFSARGGGGRLRRADCSRREGERKPMR